MRCDHFDAGTCGSCTLLALPHADQVAQGEARVRELLAPFVAVPTSAGADPWLAPLASAEAGFRARAKMAVAGTAAAPVLTLPGQSTGADLAGCPLYPPAVEPLLAGVRELIRRAQVPPYDVARRRGELKYAIVTVGGEDPEADPRLMLQLVLRTDAALPRLREHLPRLLAAQPRLASAWANLQPQHAAVLTGPEDLHLAGEDRLPMRVGDAVLRVGPSSFVQTNTAVAGGLYRQVAQWAAEVAADRPTGTTAPIRVWDLYCGLGGFALHIARSLPAAQVTGVEVSADAIAGARLAASDLLGAEAGERLRFLVEDATAWAARTAAAEGEPDLVVVNPPRRGLGPELCAVLEGTSVPDVIYSSCNPQTLAADLARMPSLRIVEARYVDMFPHTAHAEVAVRLRRARA